MGITRRQFLKGTGVSAVVVAGGGALTGIVTLIKLGTNNTDWEKKVATLIRNSGSEKDGVVVYDNNIGYQYNIEVQVGGEFKEVHVRLCKDYELLDGKKDLIYTIGDTTVSVKVFDARDTLEVRTLGKTMTDPTIIEGAKQLTDKVLDALMVYQGELIKARNCATSTAAKRDVGYQK